MEISTNLGRVALAPRGAYDQAAVYRWLDVVQYDGSSYLVLKNGITGIVPADGADYMLLALKGSHGEPGSSIASIERTGGSGAPGTTDTYTITLTDGGKTAFRVYNGADGKGAGDMTKAVYDPQGKAQDIFRYVDDALAQGGGWDKAGTAQQLVDGHNADPDAHEDRFAQLEAAVPEAISLEEIDALMGAIAQ